MTSEGLSQSTLAWAARYLRSASRAWDRGKKGQPLMIRVRAPAGAASWTTRSIYRGVAKGRLCCGVHMVLSLEVALPLQRWRSPEEIAASARVPSVGFDEL